MLPTSSKSCNKRSHFVLKHPQCYAVLLLFILVGLFVTAALQFWPPNMSDHGDHGLSSSYNTESIKEVKLGKDSHRPKPADQSCLYHTCFDVYHCGYNDDSRISVYVYPTMRFVDERGILITLPMSQEFSEIRQTVMDSIYYTRDPDKACLFLPPVDFLNQNNIRLVETASILAALPHWNEGINHLLFNMLPGSMPDYNTTLDVARDRALLAGGGFSTWTYRQTYDVAIPVFNPQVTDMSQPEPKNYDELSWRLVSAQIGLHIEYRQELTAAASKDSRFLLLEECNDAENNKNISARCKGKIEYLYPQILQDSVFCLVVRGARLGQTALVDALMAGCIPVIVADSYVLPFSEVLDWKRAAVLVEEDNLASVMAVLSHISPEQAVEMRHQVAFLWRNYFSSMRSITLTTLQIINDRVFPYVARTYEDWNDPPDMVAVHNPLFLPLMSPRTDGFTAVILTYDRLESLFRVIQQVALAPSLTKVLVVWNNQAKTPPQASMWPKINKPLKVIQTRQNKLSNRFYPYDAIETEAILALDDDILMLTTDELEFGYQVWREFPDRLVGFPSRLHLWDNVTGTWKYESEWTSAISLVLTGAAFHHKYYSYVYTNMMPGHIKTWVDDHMNCEDLAMNFLISNATAKAPIKVTPRQKFKCPECQSLNMLSADLTHMVERSECITKFAGIYGMMPLKTVEFRADPVLYKDSAVSRKLQRFPDIGSL